jgi:hypothetical protein
VTQIADWKADITREKSLWQVYRVARRFKVPVFNTVVRIIILVALTGFCAINEFYFHRSLVTLKDLADTVRGWSEAGIGFGSQVLGFLVAGFTIFATLTKPALFIDLARTYRSEAQVSGLKFIFFNFIFVFVHYVAFLFACVVIKMFGSPSGMTTVVLRKVSGGTDELKVVVIYAAFIVMGFWFLNLLILLKSFVWNVYQSVVLSIVYEGDQIDAQAARASRRRGYFPFRGTRCRLPRDSEDRGGGHQP